MSIMIVVMLFFSFFWGFTTTVSEDSGTSGPVVSQVSADGGERLINTLPGAETLGVATDTSLRFYVDGVMQEIAGDVPQGELVMADGDPMVLLAGDHDPCMAGQPGTPLARSDDGGQTWTTASDAAPLLPLAIWPDGLALASDCAGLHLSTDAGVTWTAMDGIPAGFDVTSFAAVAGDDTERIALVGLTSEGGTSTLHSIDLTDPAATVVSEGLRQYYAVGGLAGIGDTYVQVGLDGAWISTDEGATWERQSEGLEGLVLERDPLEFGLPQDFNPNSAGMDAVVETRDGETLIAGTRDGLYQRPMEGTAWTQVAGTTGHVESLAVSADGTMAIYMVEGVAHEVELPNT